MKIKWMDEPEQHDYPAAESYLSLVMPEDEAMLAVAQLREAPMTRFKAKDIFRASKETLLGVSNRHVDKNTDKIEEGEELSPILLVRDQGRVVIADGYHRVCAVYRFDEDAWIPCKIV